MIVDGVRLKNFRSHRDTTLSLGRGATVIIGENGAGKTSILDAISFALFKEKPSGVGVDELISLGESEAEVSVDFHSNGRKYRVRRMRTKKRGAESYFYLLGGEMETLIAKGEREVTVEVEKTLGMNGELFTSAVYIRQGEIDRLLSSDAGTRKQHIGRLIGTEDIETAHKNMLQITKDFDVKISGLSRVPEELVGKKEVLKDLRSEIKKSKAALKEIEKEIITAKADLKSVEKRRAVLEDIQRREQEIEKDGLQLRYYEKELNRLFEYEAQLAGSEPKHARYVEIEKELEMLQTSVSEHRLFEERAAGFRRENDRVKSEIKKVEKRLRFVFEQAAQYLDDAVSSGSQLKAAVTAKTLELQNMLADSRRKLEEKTRILGEGNAELDSVRKALFGLDDAEGSCPICGRELTPEHKETLRKKYNQEEEALSAKIGALAGEIKWLRSNASELEKQIAILGAVNVESALELEARLSENRSREIELGARLISDGKKLETLPPLLKRKKMLEAELKSLASFKEAHTVALGFLRKNLGLKDELKGKTKALKNDLSKRAKMLHSLEKKAVSTNLSFEAVFEKTRLELRNIQPRLTVLEKKESSTASALAVWGKRTSELKLEIKKLDLLSTELDRLRRFKGLLEKIRSVFHKDRLQRELRLKARPLIEDYTREVFNGFNLPYTDLTLTDDYSIKVHSPRGAETLDMLSGGERIAAALALRVGLSRALSGPVMELIILDEPTIHLDVLRRRELVDVIKRLATIPQTIVVTHDKEFEEGADRIIEVQKADGVSVVR